MPKTSRGPSAWRGARRGNDNTRDGRRQHQQPREGGKCSAEKNKVEKIQHKKKHTHRPVRRFTRKQGTLVAPRLWAEDGVGRAKLNNDVKVTALRLGKRRFTFGIQFIVTLDFSEPFHSIRTPLPNTLIVSKGAIFDPLCR